MADTKPKGVLVDLTRCIGCRGCQVACKAWNERSVKKTVMYGNFTNPPELNSECYTNIRYVEQDNGGVPVWSIREEPVSPLQEPCVRFGLPGRGAEKDGGGTGDLQLRAVYRMPLLHAGMSLLYTEIRVGEGGAAGEEMHLLLREDGERPCPGLR